MEARAQSHHSGEPARHQQAAAELRRPAARRQRSSHHRGLDSQIDPGSQRPPSLERLLDCAGEREQTLLDENGHFADEIHRLAALLEDTRVPFDATGEVVDSALVGIRPILKLAQLENRGPDLVGKFLLFARIPLDPLHHFAAFVIEVLNSPANISFAFFCRSDSVPVTVSEMAFCRSSSGAPRAAQPSPLSWRLPPKRSRRRRWTVLSTRRQRRFPAP